MQTRRGSLILYACSLILAICPLVRGQANGSLSGTVSDKSGSAISGATVRITSQETGLARELKTDGTGHYLVPFLPVASFTVRVESPGFQTTEQKDVRLQVDEQREIDFMLNPSSVSSTVEVSATEVAVETTNPTLGQVITSKQVADLPLNGRDFVQLATLTPGVTQETNPSSFFNGGPSSEVSARGSYSLSVGGSRASSTDWLLDGNDNNELTAGGIAILPSIDAIQEFKVLTFNYSVEYGTRGGPTVLVTTKSGSNQLHGSLFEFFRNTDLDARSYFASGSQKFNLNQFGGSLGGPIQKDKTFFFIDYQAKMQRYGVPFVGLVPTAAMQGGDFTDDPFGNPNPAGYLHNPYITGASSTTFQCDGSGNPIPANPDGSQTGGSPCNKIPSNLLNPIAQQMIQLYPAANANNSALGYNYANVPVRKLNEGEFDIRLDHNFSSKDSVFARFSYDQATSFVPGGAPGFAEQSPFASNQNITNHGRNVAVSETHIFSDRTINQISAGFNRIFNVILSFGNGSCQSAKFGIPGANLASQCDSYTGLPPSLSQSTQFCMSCGLTSTQMSGGYFSLGDRGYAPFQGGTNVYSLSDSLTMIRGSHDIRVGGSIRANQLNVLTNGFQDGYWIFTSEWAGDNVADLLLGLPDLGLHDQTFKGATTGTRWKLFRPYIQDDWRVTKNLTANIGLAWALVTPMTEADNRQANFDFATGQFLIPGPLPSGCTNCIHSNGNAGVRMDKTAFEPRIGLAWKPLGSATTAVRAGYAIFHDSSWNVGSGGKWQNPPYFAESNYTGFFPDLCPFATAACALTYGLTPTGKSMSEGFPVYISSPNPDSFVGTLLSQNLNFKQGQIQQFNLNIEHQLPGQVVLTAGYAGSRSAHLLVSNLNLNVGSPAACGVVSGYTLGCGLPGEPYPQFGTITDINDVGAARYDSLQVKAETKSARHGLYALLGFTWARNFDSGLNDGVGTSTGTTYWPLPGTQKADWALSQIQLNDNFTASVIYDLPIGRGKRFGGNWDGPVNAILGNWQLNVIEKATSGFPVFMIASNNQSGVNFTDDGASTNRPNQICDGRSSHPTLGKWFNTQCFVDPPAGELGNAPRTPVYGPNFVNTDFSAVKHFPLPWREGMRLDFRAEFFNIFNHPQFFVPNSDVDSPATFGIVNSTVNNGRLIQFALKLSF